MIGEKQLLAYNTAYDTDMDYEKLANEAKLMGEVMADALLREVERFYKIERPKQEPVVTAENLAQILMFEPGHE
jgi:hypothetical protein